ncbi:BTAD domain-containing putative transcriptional regulator [Streptomyces sp. NPDC046994]|uniref:AfsR/SARP family transcriptional regulator n=1 Tax=Streptomyces sp. NPDC046994 TaxID=3155735 RepID=UPI003455E218
MDLPQKPVRWTLLGSLAGRRAGENLVLGPPQRRSVLAALLVRNGSPVTLAEFIDVLWGQQPPENAANVVHRHIGELRRLLEPGLKRRATGQWLLPSAEGYRLRTEPGCLDLQEFRSLVHQARATTASPGPLDLWVQALSLWTAPVVRGITPQAAQHPMFTGLQREYAAALAEAADAALQTGAPEAVVAPLQVAVRSDPLDEPLQARLILCLAAAGRQSEALDNYQSVRSVLADELGIDPGAELKEAHRRVLSGLPPHMPSASVSVPPAQLPPAPEPFTGRRAEVARLVAEVDGAAAVPGAGRTLVIGAIGGMAGVGKTALALHLAHRLSDRFPDGQLYADLRGFDPSRPPLSPQDVLRGFLCGLGVMPQHMPRDPDGQTALYRSVLAGRRVLVVLDNALDSDQVRPLLPGTSDSLVLVTSRNKLLGLVANEGARPVDLGVLDEAEARALLADRVGSARTAAEPEAVREITALCGRLPLALAIVAARLATHRGFTMAAVAQHMRETGPLSGFVGPDSALDIRNVFSWSCQKLSPAAARLFRLLALRPGPDITAPAAAALADRTVTATGRSLAELSQTHLVIEHVPGRFALHDLLQAYALELVEAETSEREQQAVLRRVLDHYLLLARAAAAVVDPEATSESTVFPHAESALGWFSSERGVLTEAIRRAAEAGLHEHAWRLGYALGGFYELSGLFHEWASVQRMAFDSAQRLADHRAHAHAHRRLGRVTSLLHGYEEAQRHLERARDLYAELDLPLDLAHAHRTLAWVMAKDGRPQEAVDRAEQALVLYRSHGETIMAGRCLYAIAWFLVLLDRSEEAVLHAQSALECFDESTEPMNVARTLDTLAFAHAHLGQYGLAVGYERRSVELFRSCRALYNEGCALSRLGDVHSVAGDAEAARGSWQASLAIMIELDPPWANALRTKLNRRDSSAPGPHTETAETAQAHALLSLHGVMPPHGRLDRELRQ